MNRRATLLPTLLLLACVRPTTGETVTPETTDSAKASASKPKLVLEHGNPQGEAPAAPVLGAMREELSRAMKALGAKADPAPYFMAYAVTDLDRVEITAADGALVSSRRDRVRALDVEIRVGSYEFDNNRIYRQNFQYARVGSGGGFGRGRMMTVEDNPAAIKAALWGATQGEYRLATEAFGSAQARKDVQVAEDDDSDDFSREEPVTFLEAPAKMSIDRDKWEKKVRGWSLRMSAGEHVLRSQVVLLARAENRYLVTTEGTTVQVARPHARLLVTASTKAEDGMELQHAGTIDVQSAQDLPDDAVVEAMMDRVLSELAALRDAPLAEPYSGPAILEGRAAAVYFHEVFGHRVEGHRQKNEAEGQTFAKKIGKPVMPDWIDIYDDPSIATLSGIDLNGHYFYDDEGVRGQRASLVKDGKLEGFLMSRSPTRGFEHSNGHGRRESGLRIAARQANLIVAPQRGLPREELKALLLQRVKSQDKPYGLRFVEIAGGFTMTSRYMPQAFQVNPVLVFRVYPDGREELVRGAALEGTPLSSLTEITAAGDEFEIFNGYCGAESGFVPVSAVSPALLLDKIEVARTPKSQSKPPLLPDPSRDLQPGGAR
ncbi:MAG: TldD/PmbA family protein [Nannocystaceae bacterium]|nr:TldD/PmbA family protein [Nannocystaceae bacterium]